jgi:hypothetical protein
VTTLRWRVVEAPPGRTGASEPANASSGSAPIESSDLLKNARAEAVSAISKIEVSVNP